MRLVEIVVISIGAYVPGTNPDVDVARVIRPKLDAFLQQDKDEASAYPLTLRQLIELALAADATRKSAPAAPGQPAARAGRPTQAAGNPQPAAGRGR